MSSQPPAAWLQGISGEWHGRQVLLVDATHIGRGSGCQVHLTNPQASRDHAVIRYAQGQYFLQDRGSLHGTMVNGQRVSATVLRDGDIISIAGSSFRFHLATHVRPKVAPAAQAPVVSSPAAPPAQLPPPEPAPHAMSADEYDRIQLRSLGLSKSYVGSAFLVLLLYWFLYLPGLILNIVYLNEAGRIQKASGVSPSGKGCLEALLFFYFWLPLSLFILAIVLGALGLINLSELLESL